MNEVYNIDCLEYMRTLSDNAFDLAVVDPPYGDGLTHTEREREAGQFNRFGGRFDRYKEDIIPFSDEPQSSQTKVCRTGGTWAEKYGKKIIAWDVAPQQEYFDELFRISRNQIIWGGNYFSLPPTRCFLVWRKLTISENFSMAMAEYAWTSFNENAKVFECAPQGKKDDVRFHPTQKPIELYDFIFRNYAKQGDKILDTHLGSGSSRIAAYKAGLDFVGCEINETYFKLAEERFEKFTSQTSLFDDFQSSIFD